MFRLVLRVSICEEKNIHTNNLRNNKQSKILTTIQTKIWPEIDLYINGFQNCSLRL